VAFILSNRDAYDSTKFKPTPDIVMRRGKRAAGPLADLEGGKAAKILAGWILPRMMRFFKKISQYFKDFYV
jgi:hypothetical protein